MVLTKNNDDHDKIREELERIRKSHNGLLNPPDIVEFAKKKKTALHKYFCWDDTKAAFEYRLEQARRVIRVIVQVIPNTEHETRVYVSLGSDRKEKAGYRAIVEVMMDRSQMDELLNQALKDLQHFRQKYNVLKELAGIFGEIKKLEKKKR